jgi:hypothetical protein
MLCETRESSEDSIVILFLQLSDLFDRLIVETRFIEEVLSEYNLTCSTQSPGSIQKAQRLDLLKQTLEDLARLSRSLSVCQDLKGVILPDTSVIKADLKLDTVKALLALPPVVVSENMQKAHGDLELF